MSTQRICEIPGNSDIAGIGVRISVYIQACLAGFNSIYTIYMRLPHGIERPNRVNQPSASTTIAEAPVGRLSDTARESQGAGVGQSLQELEFIMRDLTSKHVEHYRAVAHDNRDYLDMIKVLERGILMVGSAVVVSAFLEASLTGLTSYHALILLNICQINNWSGFILLYTGGGFGPPGHGGWIRDAFLIKKQGWVMSIPWLLHSAMMSAFGLYFWSDLKPFLRYVTAAEEECRPLTYFWLFGPISIPNSVLHILSLVFYAINAFPIIGLHFLTSMLLFVPPACVIVVFITFIAASILLILSLLPAIFTSALLYAIIKPILVFIFHPLFRIPFIREVVAWVRVFISRTNIPRTLIFAYRKQMETSSTFFAGLPYNRPFLTLYLGTCLCAPLVYTIVSTELIVHVNRPIVEPEAENRWTYGQTLAMFTALVSLVLYVVEVWKLVIRRRRRKLVQSAGKNGTGRAPAGDSDSLPLKPRPLFVEKDIQTELDD